MRTWTLSAALAALTFAASLAVVSEVEAQQQTQSRLYEVTKNKKLRVCQYPLYYSISFRNPTSGKIEGIDADLAVELAKELGAELEIVESGFATFIADLQANKCEIGMFGVGATLKRGQAVEFSKPYLITNIYAVTRKGGKIKAWEDIDQKGIKAAVSLGSYIEVFMKNYLKNAEVVSVAPPNTREAELVAQRVDVIMTDFPTAIKVTDEFDWAAYLLPKEKLAVTPYAYVVPPGDQIWLNFINLFVDTIKLDGRLMHYAKKHKLDPIVAPSAPRTIKGRWRHWDERAPMSYRFRWDAVWNSLDFLMAGLQMTLFLSATTLVLAMIGGLIIAGLDMSRWRILRWIGVSFGEIIRNTPILVQLLWVYYVLPIVFNVGIGAVAALIIGLSVYQASFISEVYRAGIQAVPKGHREAAQVLGLTPVQSFRRIVLPQAIRMTLPPLASNFVQLIKFSSLGAVISVSEITRRGMELSSSTFRPLEIFTFIAVVYFFICWPLAMAIRLWERRLANQ